MTYDAVIFDMDGVLLTGEHTPPGVYETATERLLEARGRDPEDVPRTLFDPDSIDAFRRACGEAGLEPEAAWHDREAAATEIENDLIAAGERRLFEDVPSVVDLPVRTGIASNNRQGTVSFVADHFDLGAAVARGREPTFAGYERLKPDPYLLERALEDLGVPATEALYVGDRASDVEAAHRAGTDAALLIRGAAPEDPEPDYRLDTLEDVAALL